VDEYQDTNKLQGDLIDLLAARTRNVMVVGDDAQSIYAWRGANFANILDFPSAIPAQSFQDRDDYRSRRKFARGECAIAANVNQVRRLAPRANPA